MKNIEIPGWMKFLSVWALWAFVAVGAVGWALFVLLKAFGVLEHAAAWVQALGSIGAIIAAGYFPIAHEKVREKRQIKNTLTSLMHLAGVLVSIQDSQYKALKNESAYDRWKHTDKPGELEMLCSLVAEFPVSMVVGQHIEYLSEIRSSCLSAAKLSRNMIEWGYETMHSFYDFTGVQRQQFEETDSMEGLLMVMKDEMHSLEVVWAW